MPIPATATLLTPPMDPSDIDRFIIECEPYLEEGEDIASWQLDTLAEASALGVNQGTGAYATVKVGTNIVFWPTVDPTKLEDPAFNLENTIPFRLTVTTNSTPPRRVQRTFVIRIVQQ